MRGPLQKQILVGTCSLAFSLLLAEFFLRFIDPVDYLRPAEPLPPSSWQELLHRRSEISGLPYELVPERKKYTRGTVIETNSFGMRDREPYSPPEDTGFHRVAVVGDSFSFGFGVELSKTYPVLLEDILNSGSDVPEFDVLNFSVGGYSTLDEALVVQHKVLPWQPRTIIVGYFLNDPEVEAFQPLRAYYTPVRWWQHSHLLRLIAKSWLEFRVTFFGGGSYFRLIHLQESATWMTVVEGFVSMRESAKRMGAKVLLVVFPATPWAGWGEYELEDVENQVLALGKSNGFETIQMSKHFKNYPPRKIMLGELDYHLTPFAHALTARELAKVIRGGGPTD